MSYLDIGAASTPMTCLLLLANLLRRPLRTLTALGSARTRRTGEPSRLIQLGQALRLIREMKRRGITHLHAHFISEPGDVAEWMNRLAGINYSISAHAKDIYLSSSEALRDKIQRASFVVTCTEYNRRHLQRIAAPGTPILRVYHGLDGARFRSLANSAEPAQGGDPLILSVGRLREKKGFPTLIEACHLLARAGYRFRCDIVGYGPDKEMLNQRIHALRLENWVHLRGQMIHEELIDSYHRASLFVLPCRIANDGDRDGIPNVLMEAMAMGIPVISTRVSGIPELIEDGVSGRLVEAGSATRLADAMTELLSDRELAASLANGGRERVAKHFAVPPHIAILKQLFHESMAPASASRLTELSPEARHAN